MEPTDRPLITRLRATNFRSIAEMDLELGPLTVLVGRNGVGKSNVVDVLGFIGDSLRNDLEYAIIERDGANAFIRRGANGSTSFGIESAGSAWTFDWTIELESEAPALPPLLLGERASFRLKGHRVLKGEKTPDATLASQTRVFPRLVNIQEQPSEISIDTIYVGGRKIERHDAWFPSPPIRPDDMLLRFRTGNALRWTDETLSMGRKYSFGSQNLGSPQKITTPTPLHEQGHNLSAVLREIRVQRPLDAQTLDRSLEALVPGVTGYSVENIGSHLVTYLQYGTGGDGQPVEFDLGQESDGTIRILAILAALYQTPSPPLIVIEEPEANLHPGALGVLADVIKEASLRSQIIITTHSPDLIDHFDVETLRVVERVNGETRVGKVKEDQREIIRQKLYRPGELMRIEGLHRENDD